MTTYSTINTVTNTTMNTTTNTNSTIWDNRKIQRRIRTGICLTWNMTMNTATNTTMITTTNMNTNTNINTLTITKHVNKTFFLSPSLFRTGGLLSTEPPTYLTDGVRTGGLRISI
jgi:hypothetical protein